jgi:hypothetical protein
MIQTDKNGCLDTLTLKQRENGTIYNIPLNGENGKGPSFYIRKGNKRKIIRLTESKKDLFTSIEKSICYTLSYSEEGDRLRINASIENRSLKDFSPETCGLKLGTDSWMESYPKWNKKLFPTHLRCEKTHFSGYCMSPDGEILAIGSPDPIASWSLDYNGGGHRIRTMNLDLLNAGPLPARHPENSHTLKPGERREWNIKLEALSSMEYIPTALAELSQAPWIDMKQTSIAPGETAELKVSLPDSADEAELSLTLENHAGEQTQLELKKSNCLIQDKSLTPGLYKIIAGYKGKKSESTLYIRQPWSWYMNHARAGALEHYQHATTHCESLYGFYTLFRAQRYLPDTSSSKAAEERWQIVFPQVFDPEKQKPLIHTGRIQNTAAMINVLTDRYRITGESEDLETAVGLARWLIEGHQHLDGSYRDGKWGKPKKGVHYTAVIYPAMNIMELMDLLQELGGSKDLENYDYLYDSVQRAMNELEMNRDNIDTEGELTFEDGMISCSAAQMARFALLQKDSRQRSRYQNAAQDLLKKHRCLTQLKTPDARQRGATLRFWEAQYDVITFPNMMNSPHGWTSWRSYALYYLYLLTGESDLIEQLMNVLGTCMQVIDENSGKLRWGFIADPYIRSRRLVAPIKRFSRDKYNKLLLHHLKLPGHRTEEKVIGEEYLDMNSSWQFGNPNDNDVHEHFRALSEIALTQGFILETESGYKAWNGSIKIEKKSLVFQPSEKIVQRIHLNLKSQREIIIETEQGRVCMGIKKQGWIKLKTERSNNE